MSDEMISMQLQLANRAYPVRLPASQAAVVQNQLQEIQQKLAQYKKQFPGHDNQDYLAMVLLEEVTTVKQNLSAYTDIIHKLQQLEEILQT